MKLRFYIISVLTIIGLLSCNSYQTLLKNQSHSVSVKTQGKHITAHLLVEDKVIHPKNSLWYYSFRGGEIFNTQGEVNGTALHGIYKENYQDGGLKEYGKFHIGLKHGVWKTWYSNGNLKTVSNFKHGKTIGKQISYDIKGTTTSKSNYFMGKKTGTCIEINDAGESVEKRYNLFGKEKNKKIKDKKNSEQEAKDAVTEG